MVEEDKPGGMEGGKTGCEAFELMLHRTVNSVKSTGCKEEDDPNGR